MRVLIADDNALVRRGIASLLSGENELEVCGEAADANGNAEEADELRPDPILLDVVTADGWSEYSVSFERRIFRNSKF